MNLTNGVSLHKLNKMYFRLTSVLFFSFKMLVASFNGLYCTLQIYMFFKINKHHLWTHNSFYLLTHHTQLQRQPCTPTEATYLSTSPLVLHQKPIHRARTHTGVEPCIYRRYLCRSHLVKSWLSPNDKT